MSSRGHDASRCELLITVTATNGSGIATAFNVTTSSADLGPFDGSDDTLIGVLNSANGGLFQIFFTVGGAPENFAGANGDGACFGSGSVALYSPGPTAAQCLQGHYWTTDLMDYASAGVTFVPFRRSHGRLFPWSVGSRRIHMVQPAGRTHRQRDCYRHARAGLAGSDRDRTERPLFHAAAQSFNVRMARLLTLTLVLARIAISSVLNVLASEKKLALGGSIEAGRCIIPEAGVHNGNSGLRCLKKEPIEMNTRIFVLMVLAATIVAADVITINDTTDTVTLSTTSTRYVVVSSTPESGSSASAMAIGVSAPTGATFGSTTIPSYFISSAAGFPDIQYAIVASENNSNLVSDVLAFSTTPFANFPAPFALFFNSDGDPATVPCDQTPHGCNVVENGPISGTITWDLATGATVVDTITFNSDVNEVPEPSAMQLLLTGLVGLTLWPHCRR